VSSVFLTAKGYDLLHAELRDLIEVRRPQVMVDLAQAREFGDISENAEYETAKRDQGLIEGRIHELEVLLASVEIISTPVEVQEAMLGVYMKVVNLDMRQEREFWLVTEQEAHLDNAYLSVDSPLGKALVGSKIGDEVTFQAPAGTRRFKVLELKGCGPVEEPVD
jgi:transcription elongation factor GreA